MIIIVYHSQNMSLQQLVKLSMSIGELILASWQLPPHELAKLSTNFTIDLKS
jgi:hypothetical protein